MIYRFSITTPANTTAKNKVITTLQLTRGVIHQIDIRFPPGPQVLTKLKLKRGLHQVWPSNTEGYFATDNEQISFREHYEIIDRPFRLEAYTWNDDDTYPHIVIIRIGILKRRFILRRLF